MAQEQSEAFMAQKTIKHINNIEFIQSMKISTVLVVYTKPLNDEEKYEIFPGWNYKEKPGTDPKRQCAEEMALQKAWNAGFRYIRAITIAGEPQDDDTSGAHHDTLHPCTTCRGHLGTLLELGAVDEQTRIFTTDPFRTHTDSMNPEELIASHLVSNSRE